MLKYKIVNFSKMVFQYKNMRFLGTLDRSSKISHWKNFLTPCHVSKIDFSFKNIENRHKNYSPNLP